MNGLNYLLQSNLYLIVFFSFYWVFLRKETFNNYNRAYLVLSGIASFVIPFWNLDLVQSWFITQKTAQAVEAFNLPALIVQNPQVDQEFSLTTYFPAVYGLISAAFALKFLTNILNLYRFINGNETLNKAFSFFNTIIIANDVDPDDVIYNHERVHASQYHSFDVLLFEIIGIFCWFNPIIYAYKIAIKNIHEFIADEIASTQLGSKIEYAMVLFSERFQTHPSVLVSNFFTKTSLKLRIEMLNKAKSKKMAMLKYGLIAPIFLGMLVFTSVAIANGKKITDLLLITSKKTIKGTLINYDKKPIKGATVVDIRTQKRTQTDEEGNFALPIQGFDTNLEVSHVSYRTKNIKVLSETPITITMRRYINELSGAFVLAADKEISIKTQSESIKTELIVEENANSELKLVEQNAEFVGGASAMYEYLRKNLRYPEEAKKNNKQGIVYIKFTVGETGAISKVRSISPLGYVGFVGYGLENEAKRVVQSMPNWQPAMQNGKPENVEYALPIQFILEENLNKSEILKSRPEKTNQQNEAKSDTFTLSNIMAEPKALIFENGLEVPHKNLRQIITETYKGGIGFKIYDPNDSFKKFGNRGKFGAVEIQHGEVSKIKYADLKQGFIEEIFTEVEQPAEFPGGQGAMGKFLQMNLKYPVPAQRANVSGKVFLSFVVKRSGDIENIQIIKGQGYGLDEEAVRVIKGMPKWIPAKQSGRVVNSQFNLPIDFQIGK